MCPLPQRPLSLALAPHSPSPTFPHARAGLLVAMTHVVRETATETAAAPSAAIVPHAVRLATGRTARVAALTYLRLILAVHAHIGLEHWPGLLEKVRPRERSKPGLGV